MHHLAVGRRHALVRATDGRSHPIQLLRTTSCVLKALRMNISAAVAAAGHRRLPPPLQLLLKSTGATTMVESPAPPPPAALFYGPTPPHAHPDPKQTTINPSNYNRSYPSNPHHTTAPPRTTSIPPSSSRIVVCPKNVVVRLVNGCINYVITLFYNVRWWGLRCFMLIGTLPLLLETVINQ